MRHSRIRCAVLAWVLTLPTVAAADSWQQFQELAAALDQIGRSSDAARLREALDSVPLEELDEVYGSMDLRPLIDGLAQVAPDLAELQDRVRATQAGFEAVRAQAVAPAPTTLKGVFSDTNGPLPAATYPSVRDICPLHGNTDVSPTQRNDTTEVLELQRTISVARIVLEQAEIAATVAKAIWSAAGRTCDQVVVAAGFGSNASLVCIIADVILAAVDIIVQEAHFTLEFFQRRVNSKNACDGAVDTAEIAANYERLDHVHRDMEIFKQEVQEQLDRMEEKIDLLLKTQLEDALQLGSRVRAGVAYTDRIDEVCAAAQEAIDDADALGYKVLVRAQALHDLGQQLIPTNPKKAFDKCKAGYQLVTKKSASLK